MDLVLCVQTSICSEKLIVSDFRGRTALYVRGDYNGLGKDEVTAMESI